MEVNVMSHKIDTYTELKHQIHEDLRAQHPEWSNPTATAPRANLTNHDWRIAPPWRTTFAHEERKQTPIALLCDDITQPA